MIKPRLYTVLILAFMLGMLSITGCGTTDTQRNASGQEQNQYIPPRPYTAA